MSVLEAQKSIYDLWNKQPDAFYFNELAKGFQITEQAIAKFTNCSTCDDSIAIVDNATTGAQIVVERIRDDLLSHVTNDQKRDVVIITHSFVYEAVNLLIKARLCNIPNTRVIEAQIPFPLSDKDQIISAYKDALDSICVDDTRVALALVDHVSSIPSVIFPVREICSLLRSHGSVEKIFVDGAHAIGMLPLDLPSMDCDFYVSNCHKWLFCPNSVAFLYVRDPVVAKQSLHHPIVSHNYGKGLVEECRWIGTRNYSAIFSVPHALKFIDQMGGAEKIRTYNNNLAWEGACLISDTFGTKIGSPKDMTASLVVVGLPNEIIEKFPNYEDFRAVIRDKYNIECFPFYREDSCWLRISAQIYNSIEDYKSLCDAVKSIA